MIPRLKLSNHKLFKESKEDMFREKADVLIESLKKQREALREKVEEMKSKL